MSHKKNINAKSVVHARIGSECYQILDSFAERRGHSLTHALRELLEEEKQRELEDASASRLESILRSLAALADQHLRMTTRIEAVVALLRSVEMGQVERENRLLAAMEQLLGYHQLIYAHLLAIVATSPRSADNVATAQAQLTLLRGEG